MLEQRRAEAIMERSRQQEEYQEETEKDEALQAGGHRRCVNLQPRPVRDIIIFEFRYGI